MATLPEVDAALRTLVKRLADVEPSVRRRYVKERTVSCRVPDLGVVYRARLSQAGFEDITCDPGRPAQVRLEVASDDLVALIEGRLPVPTAWATGRLKIEASLMDLLKLRSLL